MVEVGQQAGPGVVADACREPVELGLVDRAAVAGVEGDQAPAADVMDVVALPAYAGQAELQVDGRPA